MCRSILSACLTLLLPTIAWAWGGEGHQIVCLIAEDHLTSKAQAGIHRLLGDAVISDAEIANFADQIKRERRETAPWHYVDIPIDAEKFDEHRDGQEGNNVIDKVAEMEKVVADSSRPGFERAEALKFLVHLVGDLHQPLHCAERNGDKGGNGRLVFFLDQQRATNLHSCWDSSILRRDKANLGVWEYAEQLNKRITDAQKKAWSQGSSLDWANESHRIAAESVYKGIPGDGPPPKLDIRYVDASAVIVDQQLSKGGVRLAMILNRIFSK